MQTIGDSLLTRGITDTPPENCAALKARLERDGDLIRIEVTDPNGRTSRREVVSEESAVNIIDSWVRGDVDLHALPLEPEVADLSSVGAAAIVPVAKITLDAATGVGFDASTWFGGQLSGCYLAGPVCVGAGLVLLTDRRLSGESRKTTTDRTTFGLNGFVEYPLTLGKNELAPGLDIGASRQLMTKTEKRVHDEEPDEALEADEIAEHGGFSYAERHAWGLTVGGHVRGAFPLARGFAFTIGLFVAAYPLADTSRRTAAGTETPMSGAPRGVVFLTLGLGYGI